MEAQGRRLCFALVLIKAARRSRQSHYLARVGDVVVVVVDDCCPLLIEFDPTLAAQLSQGVTCRDTRDSLSQVTETQKQIQLRVMCSTLYEPNPREQHDSPS